MRRIALLSIIPFICLASLSARAQIVVNQGWVRGVVPGQKSAAAFMFVTSGSDAWMIGASSPVARSAEIHNMKFEGGIMKMRAVDKLPLRAGKTIEFTPGGLHIMLVDVTRPLKEGDMVPVTLQFEDRTGRKWPFDVKLPVKAPTASSNPAGH
jgi:copper(I)-binding protein